MRLVAALAPALGMIGLLALAGCAHDPGARHAETLTPPTVADHVSPVMGLLEYADMLDRAAPKTRETAVRQMRAAVRAQPTAANYARLSMALAAPRQRLYTPDEAARYARKALAARPNPWDRVSRRFLTDQARRLDRISCFLTADQPRVSSPADTARRDPADARVAQLMQELAAARAKITALSNIETQLEDDEPSP